MQQVQVDRFQKIVSDYYVSHGRHDLPWRKALSDGSFDPYRILVSEVMLQQTQVPRVIPKFTEFVAVFPNFKTLASSSLADVLRMWSGLGYNRRAKFLWQTAQIVSSAYSGELPRTSDELVQLPGIGTNTAGALLAYAYNLPSVFIETNVRTVFIYHFFADQETVDDRDILELVAATLPDDFRSWYWALMDYGTHLKQTVGNLNKLSRHYAVQSKFAGSKRQLRGSVLRLLGGGAHSESDLQRLVADERLADVLTALATEGLIELTDLGYKLPGA
jgi:A/G-specific adenine glycosylase